ncbi:helix-turn-helix transcriptional regulator [Ferrimonas sediminum]|nr:hypothetical protein [Ferrimonas sediminum]
MSSIDFDCKSAGRTIVEKRLKAFALENSLEDIFYSYDINIDAPISHAEEPRDLCKRFKKRKQVFFSSEKGRNYFKVMILDRLNTDSEFKSKFEKKLYKKDGANECKCVYDKRRHKKNLLTKKHDNFGYEKKFELIIACSESKYFFARFIIMTNDHNIDESYIVKKLKPSLLKLNKEIINYFKTLMNPICDYQHVKQNSLRVLECLAKGMNRDEIADELYLTVRGVDYHIELLKSSLVANNIANLIYKACALNLLK